MCQARPLSQKHALPLQQTSTSATSHQLLKQKGVTVSPIVSSPIAEIGSMGRIYLKTPQRARLATRHKSYHEGNATKSNPHTQLKSQKCQARPLSHNTHSYYSILQPALCLSNAPPKPQRQVHSALCPRNCHITKQSNCSKWLAISIAEQKAHTHLKQPEIALTNNCLPQKLWHKKCSRSASRRIYRPTVYIVPEETGTAHQRTAAPTT